MSDRVVGTVPRAFRDPSIQLFRADERVFEGMIEGWRTQMLARGAEVDTIKAKLSLVKRFQGPNRPTRLAQSRYSFT